MVLHSFADSISFRNVRSVECCSMFKEIWNCTKKPLLILNKLKQREPDFNRIRRAGVGICFPEFSAR
jgi:hypothetical protein